MGLDGQTIILLGCNHHRTPLEIRERIALGQDDIEALYPDLAASADIVESLVLNTCNRIEIYAVVQNDNWREAVLDALAGLANFSVEHFLEHAVQLKDEEVVFHLFKVAAGLESQIVGETEILGQVKSAYEHAQRQKSLGPVLHRLFQKCFQAAKWARTHTGISQGQVSLGNVAVDLSARIFGSLGKVRSMVVGSGEVGRDVAKALQSRGVRSMYLTSRRLENSRSLAEDVEGQVIPFKTWKDELPFVDVAIFATSSPGYLLSLEEAAEIMEQRKSASLFVIDLAVPRDVDPSVTEVSDIYLYNFDDLAKIANENLELRHQETGRCKRELQERAERMMKAL